MPKGFNLQCSAGKTARVWLQGKSGALARGRPWCSYLLRKERPTGPPLPIAHRSARRGSMTMPAT